MRKFYQFLLLFFVISGFAQSVNLYNPADNSVYPSQLYFCRAETFNLKVDATATSTGDYAITKAFPSDFGLSAGSIPITFPGAGADKFSDSFPIGFDFSFYGKTYKKVVAGSNGRLVFTNDPELENLKNTTTFTDRTFSGIAGYNSYSKLPSKNYNKVYKTAPTQELNLAQIFFGYTDLVPKSKNGSVTYLYKNVVLAGVNGLMVSFQNQIRTNGLGGDSSTSYYSYILLLEDGRIIISVYNKSETTYNAILGIQNDDASKFKVPVHSNAAYDYNNGPWNSEGTAFVFTPNQNLTPQFKWFRNATLLTETSNTLSNFAPNDNDVLKIEVAYFDSSNVQVGSTVSDQITFKKIAIPVVTSSSGGGCVSGVTLSVPPDPDLNFEWFMVGNPAVLGTGNTYFATQTGNYYVKVSRKTLPSCSESSATVPVNLSSTIPPFNAGNKPFYFCETAGAPSKTINLYDYYPANPSQYSLVFKDNGVTVADPANFVLAANSVKTVAISVNDPVSGCTIDTIFNLRFDSLPGSVNNLPKKFCFGATSVDVSQYLQDLAGANFAIFDYQYSTDGTNYSTNSITNPKAFPKVYIKILPKNPPVGSCSTVSTIIFSESPKVLANTPIVPLAPQCASATQTFDLASLIPQINPSPNVTVTFHESLLDAQTGANPVNLNYRSGLGNTTLYIRVVDTFLNCAATDFPEINLLVYLKPKLLKNKIDLKNCAGNTFFDLTQNPSSLTDATSPVTVTLEYYSTNNTLLSGTQITNYNEAVFGPNPYIKVIYNTTCSDVVTFNLSYNPKPVSRVSQILICSEITYSLQNFKDAVILASADYSFSDLSGNPLPTSFDVSVLPKTVQFIIKNNLTGCISDPQSVTFLKGGNSVLLAAESSIEKCDSDFDGKTDFNLDDVKGDFTTDPAAIFEYFKDAAFTQSINSNFTNDVAFAQTIFVRITLPGFCPANAKINLKVNVPTKSTTLLDKYFICFGETITVDAGSENVSWNWSTGETSQTVDFSAAGSFSVELTNALGCKYTHQFIISSENQPIIEVVNQTNNSIEVIANGGVKPYKYYFNGVPQNSNILQNPTAASYEIQVESATGCFGPPKTVYFIKINNAFTPNADGINDVWSIENLDKMEQISIVIVDRNGAKVFESTNSSKTQWDGKSFGRSLPTSAYWYAVSWYDPVTQKNEQRQGWILLKNRD